MLQCWRPVVGFDGIYSISDHGDVRRDAPGHGATAGRILKPSRRRYLTVNLRQPGRVVTAYVHVLVATAFLGPCPNGKEVNHRDGNKHNPRLSNLEYLTRGGNVAHGYANGLYPSGEAKANAKLTIPMAIEIRALAGIVSKAELARRFGVCRATIADVLNGKTWHQMPREAVHAQIV